MQQLASIVPLSVDRLEPAEMVAPLVPAGIRLACAMLHDPQTAEDVVQEASLIAWRKLSRGASPANLKAWFLGIVAYECRNARRGKWRLAVRLGLPEQRAVAASDEQVLRRSDIRRALARLAHADRLIVVLFFYLDMPLDEVAAVMGTSVAAARSRLYRSIRRLRPDLEVEEAMS